MTTVTAVSSAITDFIGAVAPPVGAMVGVIKNIIRFFKTPATTIDGTELTPIELVGKLNGAIATLAHDLAETTRAALAANAARIEEVKARGEAASKE